MPPHPTKLVNLVHDVFVEVLLRCTTWECSACFVGCLQDGHKQDALDLISGAYKVKKDVKLTFQRQYSPLVPVLMALAALGYALSSARALAVQEEEQQGSSSARNTHTGSIDLAAVGKHVLAPLLLAAGLLMLVVKNGRQLVDRPQLCPQLAHTVAAAESSAKQQ